MQRTHLEKHSNSTLRDPVLLRRVRYSGLHHNSITAAEIIDDLVQELRPIVHPASS